MQSKTACKDELRKSLGVQDFQLRDGPKIEQRLSNIQNEDLKDIPR